MKRIISALVATGVLGATLTGTSPASAATSAIDCAAGGYTRVVNSYVPTNVQRPAVDGRSYNIGGPPAYTFEICLDIPDTSTFTIEIRIWADQKQTVFVDDQPGDKIFRYSVGPNSFWQVYGTLTGPGSTYLYYTWYEKQIPA
ncbi:unnamed protein product [[Actinomadura] parvosata subsp. kistnae]|uniref:Streptomyces killer toxin-like beta/gamma crystallin domain-containing protein n=1 Tax=[Actinomadura] parvosata subsp. kistnae TaxID=1909395 RepID=A0A1V0ABI2_9ACTN|nr:hypothetical protein [Nonomuraea sp. ATCC 55076]AQZ67590.1 hypothetical protein BKM31_44510 [Nonomuraea sp. ATCC 55076]SPL94130.1 unnamed protein product [Actinomadura parvosata subsp. kistnae]